MPYRKLGRTSSQRKAMLRDLTTDLLINGRITTTEARAKEVRKTTDKMITLGKRGDLNARRQAAVLSATKLQMLSKMVTMLKFNQLCKSFLMMLPLALPNVMVVIHGFSRLSNVVATPLNWSSWSSLINQL